MARSGFLILMLEKLNLFGCYVSGSIDVKWMGLFLKKNNLFNMLGLPFSSKLDWSSYIVSIAKTASKKI